MAWTAAKIPDQSGAVAAVAVVTGANGGLGLEPGSRGRCAVGGGCSPPSSADHHARLRQ
jgi:hypothetical protein